jgi:primosomal protein N' (replication factor Y)
MPDEPAVRCAKTHDYLGFCASELAARRELSWPPFSRVVAVRVDAGGESQAERAADMLARHARSQSEVRDDRVEVLGPAPAPIARIRGRHRQRFLLRSADRRALRAVAVAISARIGEGVAPARATLDVDPIAML